jgi:hypothetical protein
MPNAWVNAEIWLETAQKWGVQRERVEAETTKQQETERENQRKQRQARRRRRRRRREPKNQEEQRMEKEERQAAANKEQAWPRDQTEGPSDVTTTDETRAKKRGERR